MHVEAMTRLVPQEVLARIASQPAQLRCELERQPPKVFLSAGVPATLAPAAELRIDPLPEGSHVILRLMWGPLPAPFPRALSAVGLLLALGLVAFSSASMSGIAAATLLGLLPAGALWRQRVGERRLQDQLSGLLGDCVWSSRAH